MRRSGISSGLPGALSQTKLHGDRLTCASCSDVLLADSLMPRLSPCRPAGPSLGPRVLGMLAFLSIGRLDDMSCRQVDSEF